MKNKILALIPRGQQTALFRARIRKDRLGMSLLKLALRQEGSPGLLAWAGCIFSVVLAAGCATPHVYKEVMKEAPAYNTKEFVVSKDALYEAVMKVVLNKNFMIEKEDRENNFLLAKRSFQKGRRTTALLLQAKITGEAADKSTVFLSAIETKETSYVSDRTRFFLWVVPLPGGGGKEASRVKEGEQIVEDKEFYQNIFSLIEKEIAK